MLKEIKEQIPKNSFSLALKTLIAFLAEDGELGSHQDQVLRQLDKLESLLPAKEIERYLEHLGITLEAYLEYFCKYTSVIAVVQSFLDEEAQWTALDFARVIFGTVDSMVSFHTKKDCGVSNLMIKLLTQELTEEKGESDKKELTGGKAK